jgi:GNAT superfamily N-acetyltransferase
MTVSSQPPPGSAGSAGADGKDYKIRPLKRGDRDAAFRLLAEDGWTVQARDQEQVLSWVVQHPELESFVAHDAAAFSRLVGMITMSHRPQLRLGGRVAAIDLFVVPPQHRGRGIGHDLLLQALRRAEALGCKQVEIQLLPEERHEFFEKTGFVRSTTDQYVRKSQPVK